LEKITSLISPSTFESIRAKHGHCASWAVWANEKTRPKENVGDLSVLDPKSNPALLTTLNPNVVFVGLNISRPIEKPFGNFHDPRPQAMDFKIRYALRESPYWGAYMTDIIKDFEQKASKDLMAFLRAHPAFEADNVQNFRRELALLGEHRPRLIAFGGSVHLILNRHLRGEYEIVRIPHYSKRISKESYREEVRAIWAY
jgi:hypothetical protein